jgi:hypothetical protein
METINSQLLRLRASQFERFGETSPELVVEYSDKRRRATPNSQTVSELCAAGFGALFFAPEAVPGPQPEARSPKPTRIRET